MSTNNKIRNLLGLADSADTNPVEAQSLEAPSAPHEGVTVSVSAEMTLIDQVLDEERNADPALWAATQLEEFRLTPGAQSLLDRAMDNMSKNTGVGIDDPSVAAEIRGRAELIAACGGDLNTFILVLSETFENNALPATIYKHLYAILKASVFVANNDYRRFLDPRSDINVLKAYQPTSQLNRELGERGFEVDARSETSPMDGIAGHPTSVDWQLEGLRNLYGARCAADEDVIPCALEDLRMFFQLTAESFGWEPETVMPFGNIMETDGSFTPLNDAVAAMDNQAIKNQVSKAKKLDASNLLLSAAADRARNIVLNAMKRKG